MTLRFDLSFNCFNHSTYLGEEPTLPRQIVAAARSGYRMIGLDVPSLLAHERDGLSAEQIAQTAQEHNVSCFEIVPLVLGREEQSYADLDTLERLARAIRPKKVLATVRSTDRRVLRRQLSEAVDRLGVLGTEVTVEFMATTPLTTLEATLDLLESCDLPAVGIVLDVWHVLLGATRWEAVEALPTGRIGFVQVCDAPVGASASDQYAMMNRRVLPGQGVLPLQCFIDLLIEKEYDGVLSVEVLSEQWRHRPLQDFTDATYRTCVDLLVEAASRSARANGASGNSSGHAL